MEGPALAGARLRAPPLAFEVQRAGVSSSCNQFHRCCRGCVVFVSVQQNNHNMLHTNPNCFYSTIYSTKSKYDAIVLRTTTNCTNNDNVPRKNSQKNVGTKIEDSHP